MQQLIFILCFLLSVSICSCSQKTWNQTSAGLLYKIYSKDTTQEKPVYGDHIWMHLQKISPKQQEIFNTKVFDILEGVEMDYHQPPKETDITTIFSLMRKGDSAVVKVPARYMDNNANKKEYYTFKLNLIDFKRKETYESEKQQQSERQNILDALAITDFLRKSNMLDATTDNYGNTFFITQFGEQKQIIQDDTVEINYVGKLLNGTVFDNSYNRNQALQFTVGKGQVIEGLDKGILNFHRGDKGLLVIPSRLGYGNKTVGKIPPNSILIFELEIMK